MSPSKSDHDAVLRVFDATDRLGQKLIGWRWTDGSPTISPKEHEVAKKLIAKAEASAPVEHLEHGTVLARIWMAKQTIQTVEWNEQYLLPDSEREKDDE